MVDARVLLKTRHLQRLPTLRPWLFRAVERGNGAKQNQGQLLCAGMGSLTADDGGWRMADS